MKCFFVTFLLIAGLVLAAPTRASEGTSIDPDVRTINSAALRESLSPCGELLDRAAWNQDNFRFYQHLEEWEFSDRAKACGFGDNIDLTQARLAHYLGLTPSSPRQPMAVAEIGGGYGRVVDFLAEKTNIPLVLVIERSRRYITKVLGNKVKAINERNGYHRFRIIPSSILDFRMAKISPIIDVVLWMWWGFSEIHPSEKLTALEIVFKSLNRHGVLVIDLPLSTPIPTAVTNYESEFVHFRMSQAEDAPTLHLHRFSQTSLITLANQAGFTHVACDEYQVPSVPVSTRRALCFFEKP